MSSSSAAGTLPLEDYQRYGRQMILNGFGLPGQLKLQHASVAVVGAGGLGCPALQYLAAAGVGRIGIIDHDRVELSNLQRQILHTEARVGMHKALSAAEALKQINSRVQVDAHTTALTPANAAALLAPYDLVLDCTDNLPTRYLLSDTAVRLRRALVSGAAQQLDGQLCVYNLGPGAGPCFRCLFPRAPAPEAAGSCAELGVLGAVTGVVGALQAAEAVKLLTGLHDGKPTMLMYSALGAPPFRSIKLRARRPTCAACGAEGERVGRIEETDYVAFCGGARPDWVARGLAEGRPDSRVRATELKRVLDSGKHVRVIDVRPPTEFGICRLPGSMNIPIKELVANPSQSVLGDEEDTETYVVCRLGNDSQLAVEALRNANARGTVKDVIGGLRAWAKEVDEAFPVY
ncbi:hypothetical protein POSPLADRAFT_1152237 [Postia placenta MAD-698-R-SB12]|uniref:Needs CLA4 to survive protein 3 n=1 Tax=Postia placenta MAD-698-R-SB12 TaxID=670580 RepID=A0A1X6MRQ2_9APHY|nr:hypothetical protein POSPLADRAFT_1152237 [Postia placenta MAD-698-R-SB12]OSX59064.1 hypothetical protein POSPLADRAFT_1152237 [Postia placenta MAD-698-R-SB12]